ncbi:MAG: hypothetical protein SPI36_02520 [Candidatus Onthovivens sp.]|nr:hypothetical protein [Candidatus Onthovivens sp.]
MLEIVIPETEQWDEVNQEFITSNRQILRLEHSLVSLSKWESKWKKPFLSNKEKTYEETIDYIKCMTLTQNVNDTVYNLLDKDNIEKINKYIGDPMTATTFKEDQNKKGGREIITSELIYYWMISLNIPFECQKWHLNRLLTLIKVCGIKNQPPKKMSKKDVMSRNAALNAARRKQMNSRG